MAINHNSFFCGCRGEDLNYMRGLVNGQCPLLIKGLCDSHIPGRSCDKALAMDSNPLFDKYFCNLPLDARPWSEWNLMNDDNRVPVNMPRHLVHDKDEVEKFRVKAETQKRVDKEREENKDFILNHKLSSVPSKPKANQTFLIQQLSVSESAPPKSGHAYLNPEFNISRRRLEFEESDLGLNSLQNYPPLPQLPSLKQTLQTQFATKHAMNQTLQTQFPVKHGMNQTLQTPFAVKHAMKQHSKSFTGRG